MTAPASDREAYRRMDDQIDAEGVPISPAHRAIAERLRAVEDGIASRNLEERLERHMDKDHGAIRHDVTRLLEGQEALANVLLGPILPPDYDGHINRDSARGAQDRIAAIESNVQSLTNGGGFSLTAGQKVSLYSAGIGGAALIISNLIGLWS